MREKYKGGNYGYDHAKQELFELLLENFTEGREKFQYSMDNLSDLKFNKVSIWNISYKETKVFYKFFLVKWQVVDVHVL